jgi:hypothetical protein
MFIMQNVTSGKVTDVIEHGDLWLVLFSGRSRKVVQPAARFVQNCGRRILQQPTHAFANEEQFTQLTELEAVQGDLLYIDCQNLLR